MKKYTVWLLRLIPALILLQTLYFKFTAAPESVEIFTRLNLEPYGRIGIGVLELVAAIGLLVPRLSGWGALLGWFLMSGALMSHITKLGFAGDMGTLALMALVVWSCCSGVIWLKFSKRDSPAA